ncbi:agmatine hydroxycinnamoyltransferase 1-like [Iris pallida]|uniref:Agmatine hydroxycinnamoyltransferase 1-like n=1 Tax=Iris pallida TaxID=29817 RepID=A0AAX6HLV5_IRIPA|nr:agmatine hydroxycinnamoyltransferase 1-like [Iris pallida]
MSTFFVAWGQTVRGAPIDPLPSYDQSWLRPRSPPRCPFEHWGYEFMAKPPKPNAFPPSRVEVDPDEITNLLLHYSQHYITTELKPTARNKYSTFEVLLAHIWRKITTARGLHDTEELSTMVRVSVNGRSRLKRLDDTVPPPSEFFGNLVLNAYPNTSAKRLVEGGLEEAAGMVHEAVAEVDGEYFQSFVDFGAVHGEEEGLAPVYDSDANVLSPNLEVDSLLRFRFQDLDFGGGGALAAFLPTWVPVDGLMVFLPSLREDGGVDVFVGLREEHAKVLRQISHSLD